jgi:hypothetical protein
MENLIWPAVALILGLAALLLFRPAINKKIAGITHATKNSVSFERPQDGGSDDQPPLLPFEETMKLPISTTAIDREKIVEDKFKSINFGTEADKTAAAIRLFAITKIELEFSNIAHEIFGSQLNLLIKISGTRSGVAKQESIDLFEQAQNNFPDFHTNRSFDEWFSFFVKHNLIAFNEERIDITTYGKDFLKHLVDTRQNYQRPG